MALFHKVLMSLVRLTLKMRLTQISLWLSVHWQVMRVSSVDDARYFCFLTVHAILAFDNARIFRRTSHKDKNANGKKHIRDCKLTIGA